MKTIWKYPFPITDRFTLNMPDGAKILTAFVQFENHPDLSRRAACLWAEVDTDIALCRELLRERLFVIVGTGHSMPEGNLQWIATFPDLPFIWHLYEVL